MDQVVDPWWWGGGGASDILKKTSKRYQFPILWAWSRGTNSSLHIFSAQYTERYRLRLRYGRFQAEHRKSFQTAFSTPKTSTSVLFLWEGPSGSRTSLFLPSVKVKKKKKSKVNHFKCLVLGYWNKKTNIINWIETCWKSHLCGRLTSWLFTKRGGVESGTTKSQIHLMAGRRTWTRNIWIRIPAP